MLDEAGIGIYEWPFGLYQLLRLVKRHLVLLHDVRDHQSCTSAYACHAVHQHVGVTQIAVYEVIRCVEEAVDLLFLVVLKVN